MTHKAIDGFISNFPADAKSLRVSPGQKRRWLQARGLAKPAGTLLADLPLLNFNAAILQQALRRFGLKLMMALHYRHAGEPVPCDGVISGRWYSNVQISAGAIPETFTNILAGRVPLSRSNHSLHDQFDYMFAVLPDKSVSVFPCGFRQSFAIAGMVSKFGNIVPADFDQDLQRGIFRDRPFRHPG